MDRFLSLWWTLQITGMSPEAVFGHQCGSNWFHWLIYMNAYCTGHPGHTICVKGLFLFLGVLEGMWEDADIQECTPMLSVISWGRVGSTCVLTAQGQAGGR